jgi:hypothetical protein
VFDFWRIAANVEGMAFARRDEATTQPHPKLLFSNINRRNQIAERKTQNAELKSLMEASNE